MACKIAHFEKFLSRKWKITAMEAESLNNRVVD
jgi:hypothetical protein